MSKVASGSWLFYGGFAASKLALQLLFIQGYGWFRDEFYYLACSRHPDFGYVDHPPLSILVLTLWRSLFGDSLVATRIPAALAGAVTVAVVGLIARELGGDRRAQALAMVATIATPLFLALNHFYSMNAIDILLWALAALTLCRLLQDGQRRGWLVLGLVLGLGLQNKISVLWMGLGIAVGLVLTARRRDLLTPWPWLGGLVSGLLFLPYVVWQIAHDWPTLEFIRNATGDKMASKSAVEFALGQIDMMGFANFPLWLAGLAFLFLARGGRFRMLGWIYVTVFLLLAASGSSRSGYLGPAYTWLLAAGAVAVVEWLPRLRWAPWLIGALLLLWGAVISPFAMPVLSVDAYIDYARAMGVEASTEERKEVGPLKQFYADMHGWDRIVDAVEQAWNTLEPHEREGAVVFTYNYGVAGAVDRLGRERGLPPATSGHNNYWFWGTRGRSADVVIVVGGEPEDYESSWESAELVTRTDCGYCMPYENGNGVLVLRGRRSPIAEMWPRLKHYD